MYGSKILNFKGEKKNLDLVMFVFFLTKEIAFLRRLEFLCCYLLLCWGVITFHISRLLGDRQPILQLLAW